MACPVGRAGDLELLVLVDDEPGPAGAEARGGGLVDPFLHLVDVAVLGLDRGLELAARLLGAAGRHQLPEERVVPVAAEVVLHLLLDLQRHVGGIDQGLLDRRGSELGTVLGERLQGGHVSRVVPVVVDHHRLRVDVRLERLERVAERRHGERPVGRCRLGEGDRGERGRSPAAKAAEPSMSSGFRVCSWLRFLVRIGPAVVRRRGRPPGERRVPRLVATTQPAKVRELRCNCRSNSITVSCTFPIGRDRTAFTPEC